MSKRGRPSKSDVFYVLNNRSKPVAEVAKDLDRTEDFVLRILQQNPLKDENVEQTEAKEPKAGDLLGRQNGVVVMTQGASEIVEPSKTPNREDCVFRPKG